jgi:hypothetical protein
VALFRRANNTAKVRTTGARILPDPPFGAHRQLLAFVDDRRDERLGVVSPAVSLVENVEVREAQA